ncbi:sugar ABC transporter permease [Streptomyces nanshensis]|nr:sugar ABC transporter permease [Streptomyces nanshensis]
MTRESWAAPALEAVLSRAVLTRDEVAHRFPLFADPESGRWTTSRRGSWTGGFWSGLLWLRARHTGAQRDRTVAWGTTDMLADRLSDDTATRGLIHWYGTALASGRRADELRERAGHACLAAMDPELGLVPWGSAFGGPRLLARADAVPGMVPLLSSTRPGGDAAALSHLERHLELCLSQEPLRPAWRYGAASGWEPCDEPAPGWSRGSAWLLLAVADGLARLAPGHGAESRLNTAAVRLTAHWMRPPDGSLIPLAEPGRPGSPLDTSAAAVAAVALLKIAAVQERRELHEQATLILRTLVREHTTGGGSGADAYDRPAGMLLDGCYDAGNGIAVRHELIWGDFFLALGLAVLTGLVGVNEA